MFLTDPDPAHLPYQNACRLPPDAVLTTTHRQRRKVVRSELNFVDANELVAASSASERLEMTTSPLHSTLHSAHCFIHYSTTKVSLPI